MMEIEAGLWGVVKAGNKCALTNYSQKQHSHSPPYPNALLFSNTLHGIYKGTGHQWAGQ
jgi:hypothetical protein